MNQLFISVISSVLLIAFSSCNDTTPKPVNTTTTDSIAVKPVINTPPAAAKADTIPATVAMEDKITDTIFQLAEVKKRADYIEQQTKGARHLKIWIAGTPEDGNKYYWVKAGEDNGFNLVTHFNFYVYPDSMRIMYYDVAEDQELTIKEWEKKEAENSKR